MLFPNILMSTQDEDLYNRLSFFGKLYGMDTNPEVAMWLLLFTIFILAVVSYVLGFAKKLKLWQNIVIYVVMFLFSIPLTFFAAFYPVAECLIVIAFVMGMYRYRLYKEKKSGKIKYGNDK